MRDDTFTEDQIALAQRLHAAGLKRDWQPGDRLIGGAPPVRVVQSVSVEGEPLVEVERGGRIQTVGVAHPRIWMPTVADILKELGARDCEGAIMFKADRFGVKFRFADQHDEYRLLTGDCPRTLSYQALLIVLESRIVGEEAAAEDVAAAPESAPKPR